MAAENGENLPCATIYVRGIDERIKIPRLIETLRELFESCGTIIDVIAKKNVKAKGQAFIVYETTEEAQEALDSLQGFDLFGIPMQLAFAKTRSDATVVPEDGEDGLEVHKKHRLAEKERKQALAATQQSIKRPATDTLADRPAKSIKPAANQGGVVPDEYLPPNKVLIIRDKPEDYTQESLVAIFSRFPGFTEVRTVPSRPTIAFVEYVNEDSAITAKEATSGMALGDNHIKVTFNRK